MDASVIKAGLLTSRFMQSKVNRGCIDIASEIRAVTCGLGCRYKTSGLSQRSRLYKLQIDRQIRNGFSCGGLYYNERANCWEFFQPCYLCYNKRRKKSNESTRILIEFQNL